jgi:nicotinamide riboside transporter PnuC
VIVVTGFLPRLLEDRITMLEVLLRLDCLSCVLTIVSTILIGRRRWQGWVLAAINSVIICVIAIRTSQLGFIPANLFCIALYGINLRMWRKEESCGDVSVADEPML